jgi:hypothetical protein
VRRYYFRNRFAGCDKKAGSNSVMSQRCGDGRLACAVRDCHRRQQRGQLDAAAGQPLLKQAPRSRHPAGYGPFLTSQCHSGLGFAFVFQHAKHECRPESFGQALDFFVQDALHVIPRRAGSRFRPDGF